MNKLKFILIASIAAILTLSCSNDDNNSGDNESSSSGAKKSSSSDEDSGSSSSTKKSSSSGSNSGGGGSSSGSSGSLNTEVTTNYTLTDQGDDYFEYEDENTEEQCSEGIFEEYPSPWPSFTTINYEIDNDIMAWTKVPYFSYDDTLNFKGTSNELIGTWTREVKNKADACEYDPDYYEYNCKNDWNITKAVFTNTKVIITRYICPAEEENFANGEEWTPGWTIKVVDCNILEISKGTDKVTFKANGEITYKGESCKYGDSKAEKENACERAWATNENDDYEYILAEDFHECTERIQIPNDFWDEDEGDDICYDCLGKVAAKPVAKAKAKAKAKFKSLLKKKK